MKIMHPNYGIYPGGAMQLSIRGNDESLSKKEIRYSTTFFSHCLLGKRISSNLSIDMIYSDLEYSWGYCYPLYYDEGALREFELTLRPSIHKKRSLKIIAHEMTHLYQFALGHLKHCNDVFSYKWHGKVINFHKKDSNDLPWEIEAMKMENVLLNKYLKHIKAENLIF